MTHKKNGFLTFCFACLPGAGQMFLGFPRRGVSLMFLFFLVAGLTGYFHLEFLVFLLPVIWFFSFFDAINRNSLSDEEFQKLTDDFPGFPTELPFTKPFSGKLRLGTAIVLILAGVKYLFDNLISLLSEWGIRLPVDLEYYYDIASYYIPQFLFALLIIIVGLYLIFNKKQDLKEREGGEE